MGHKVLEDITILELFSLIWKPHSPSKHVYKEKLITIESAKGATFLSLHSTQRVTVKRLQNDCKMLLMRKITPESKTSSAKSQLGNEIPNEVVWSVAMEWLGCNGDRHSNRDREATSVEVMGQGISDITSTVVGRVEFELFFFENNGNEHEAFFCAALSGLHHVMC